MAKAKAAAPSDGEILAAAVGKVAEVVAAGGEAKLAGKGELFAAKKGAVYDRCFDPAEPLLVVYKPGKVELARPTAAGLLAAAGRLDPERVGAAAEPVAATMPPGERFEFLTSLSARVPDAMAELVPLLEAAGEEQTAAEAAEAKRRAKRLERDAANLAALERWKAAVEGRRSARIAALTAELAELGAESASQPAPAVALPLPVPLTKDDASFRRQVANRLVSVWLEACRLGRDEPRRFVEAALANVVGIAPVGEPGDDVLFDGARHRLTGALGGRTQVRVARPGWILEDEEGEHVLAPALVE